MADASSPTKVWRGNDAGSQHARSPIPCQHEMVEAETLGRPGYRMAKSDGQRCDAPGIPRAGVVFRHDCRVADLGKPARFNHLSKTVLSAMHVGGTDSTQRLPSQSSNMVLSTVKKGPLAGDRTTRHTLNYLPKLKPKWDVHLLDEGNRAGRLAGALRLLIAGLFGSAAGLPLSVWPAPSQEAAYPLPHRRPGSQAQVSRCLFPCPSPNGFIRVEVRAVARQVHQPQPQTRRLQVLPHRLAPMRWRVVPDDLQWPVVSLPKLP